jgi:hypothetical protein
VRAALRDARRVAERPAAPTVVPRANVAPAEAEDDAGPDAALLGAAVALCALALAGIGVVSRVRREWEPA